MNLVTEAENFLKKLKTLFFTAFVISMTLVLICDLVLKGKRVRVRVRVMDQAENTALETSVKE